MAQIQDYASGQAHDPFLDGRLQACDRAHHSRPPLRAAISVSGKSGEHDWPLSALSRVVGALSLDLRKPRRAGVILRHARLCRPAGAVAAGLVRRVLSDRARHRGTGAEGRRLHARRSAAGDRAAARDPGEGAARLRRGGASADRSSCPRRRTTIPSCRCCATPMPARSRRPGCRCRRGTSSIPTTPPRRSGALSIRTRRCSACGRRDCGRRRAACRRRR